MLQTIDLSSLRTARASFHPARARDVALTPEVSALLASDAVVAIGVSGGKDSVACALAVARHLDAIGHNGPRILVHSDLGRVEWKDSGPACERLAAHLGWELLTLQRQAGDMLARWEKRWSNNVERYRDLSCVRLILPWSTPSMRFCTSELKGSLINSALNKRFPTHNIVSITGVRRQESSARSKMAVAAPLAPLSTKGRTGVTWNAIIEWTVDDVFTEIAAAGLALHEAYTVYGASRVSCAYCIMSSLDDLRAAASCTDNHDVYREMVRLEAQSTFAFQGQRWLADVAPHLLSPELAADVARAKAAAIERQAIEAEIPAHLLFSSGWPTARPTPDEAELLASVRRRVARTVGIEVGTPARPTLCAGTTNCWHSGKARLRLPTQMPPKPQPRQSRRKRASPSSGRKKSHAPETGSVALIKTALGETERELNVRRKKRGIWRGAFTRHGDFPLELRIAEGIEAVQQPVRVFAIEQVAERKAEDSRRTCVLSHNAERSRKLVRAANLPLLGAFGRARHGDARGRRHLRGVAHRVAERWNRLLGESRRFHFHRIRDFSDEGADRAVLPASVTPRRGAHPNQHIVLVNRVTPHLGHPLHRRLRCGRHRHLYLRGPTVVRLQHPPNAERSAVPIDREQQVDVRVQRNAQAAADQLIDARLEARPD
ncbi:phosphoadenosine phosphosulfate reductase family protein [Caballeronia sp. AZ1_KS37]|uniref:phosphoadenosine phosphosulfate reductase family protein n=1 Tax=Caballeronia sp. AZ1_KS37 TaxID=2921756 RepID=UPI00202776BE|nr:phosphoadenosine phosphosulfate reductase family protein [Caballeronia sp. AZ1_KS37]